MGSFLFLLLPGPGDLKAKRPRQNRKYDPDDALDQPQDRPTDFPDYFLRQAEPPHHDQNNDGKDHYGEELSSGERQLIDQL